MPGRGRGRSPAYDPWQPPTRHTTPSLTASLPPPLRDEYVRQFSTAPKAIWSDPITQKYEHLEATIDEWARYTFRCRKAVLKADAALASTGASPGSALKLADDWESKVKAVESEMAGVKASLDIQKKIAAVAQAELEKERKRHAEDMEKMQRELDELEFATRAPQRGNAFEEDIAVTLPPTQPKPAASPARHDRPSPICNGHPGRAVAIVAHSATAHTSALSSQLSSPADLTSTQYSRSPHRQTRGPLLTFGTIDPFSAQPSSVPTQNQPSQRPNDAPYARSEQMPPHLNQVTAKTGAPAVAITPATPGSLPSHRPGRTQPISHSNAVTSNGRTPVTPLPHVQPALQQQAPARNLTSPHSSSAVSNTQPPVPTLHPQTTPVNNVTTTAHVNIADITINIPRSPANHSGRLSSSQTRSVHRCHLRESATEADKQNLTQEKNGTASQSQQGVGNGLDAPVQMTNSKSSPTKPQAPALPTNNGNQQLPARDSSDSSPRARSSQAEKPTVYHDPPHPHTPPARLSFAAALGSKNTNSDPTRPSPQTSTPHSIAKLTAPSTVRNPSTQPMEEIQVNPKASPPKPKNIVPTTASAQPGAANVKDQTSTKDSSHNVTTSKRAKKREKQRGRKAKTTATTNGDENGWSWA